MNKAGLIEAVRIAKGLTRLEAISGVNLFFDEMAEALAGGDRVEIQGIYWAESQNWRGSPDQTQETTLFQGWKRAEA